MERYNYNVDSELCNYLLYKYDSTLKNVYKTCDILLSFLYSGPFFLRSTNYNTNCLYFLIE